jgi:hypothetical protein
MFQLPADTDWPNGNSQRHFSARLDSAQLLDYFDTLPGRSEPLKRTRTGVPTKNLVSRGFDPRSLNESWHVEFAASILMNRRRRR